MPPQKKEHRVSALDAIFSLHSSVNFQSQVEYRAMSLGLKHPMFYLSSHGFQQNSRFVTLTLTNEGLFADAEKNKNRIQELEDQIRILKVKNLSLNLRNLKMSLQNKNKKKERSPRRKKLI